MDYNLMVLMHDPTDEWFSPNLLLKKFSPKVSIWKEMGKIDGGDREIAFYHNPLFDKSTEALYIYSNFCLGINRNRKSPTDEWFSPNLLLKKFSPKVSIWKEMGKIDGGDREIAFYHNPLFDKSTEALYIFSNFCLGINRNRKSPSYWPYIAACNMKNFASKFLKLPKDARKGLYSDNCRMDIFK